MCGIKAWIKSPRLPFFEGNTWGAMLPAFVKGGICELLPGACELLQISLGRHVEGVSTWRFEAGPVLCPWASHLFSQTSRLFTCRKDD